MMLRSAETSLTQLSKRNELSKCPIKKCLGKLATVCLKCSIKQHRTSHLHGRVLLLLYLRVPVFISDDCAHLSNITHGRSLRADTYYLFTVLSDFFYESLMEAILSIVVKLSPVISNYS